MNLEPIGNLWSFPLPTLAGSCDYAFCRGATGSLHPVDRRTPAEVKGIFGIRPPEQGQVAVKLAEVTDGTSNTIALGDAAGGTPGLFVRDLANPTQPVNDVLTGQPAIIEQTWGAAGASTPGYPFYGSVLATTAQYGLGSDPRDEPMNRKLLTPSLDGGDSHGDNRDGDDWVSGFRSRHPGGCNFLFADASVRFLPETITPGVYRALSTMAGGEVVGE
jgi:prepilin-type processing-associated H-X9-DG protein